MMYDLIEYFIYDLLKTERILNGKIYIFRICEKKEKTEKMCSNFIYDASRICRSCLKLSTFEDQRQQAAHMALNDTPSHGPT